VIEDVAVNFLRQAQDVDGSTVEHGRRIHRDDLILFPGARIVHVVEELGEALGIARHAVEDDFVFVRRFVVSRAVELRERNGKLSMRTFTWTRAR